jgi:predicted RNase H-like nuclease (RuvC/YqgF family)
MDEIRNPIVALVAVGRIAASSGRGSPFHSLGSLVAFTQMTMNFHEASEIARSNPGAVLMRDDTGGFVVLLNGKTISPIEKSSRDQEQPQHGVDLIEKIRERTNALELERQRMEMEHQQIVHQYEEQITRLQSELKVQAHEINRVNYLCNTIRQQAVSHREELESSRAEISALTAKLKGLQRLVEKLPADELGRLREFRGKELAIQAEEKRNFRKLINCSCGGESEKCFKCAGTGSYYIDGYGNVA